MTIGPVLRRPARLLLAACAFLATLATAPLAFAQANGKLQLHFMDVGQGDAALLISPKGETVLFDNGVRHFCSLPVSYLQQLGVRSIDYHIVSHYHADHIGCTSEVFAEFPLRKASIDRGGSYTTDTYKSYVTAVNQLRRTATPGMVITLDSGTANPVTISIEAVNGLTRDGHQAETRDENDKSVVALVRFGMFDAVFGGDVSGEHTSSYRDVETSVGPRIGQVEVYKTNHHGSQYSSNKAWLDAVKPLIAILSVGVGNTHEHPRPEAMDRLHATGAKTYWTTAGAGLAQPKAGTDVVGGNIVVETEPGSPTFSVTYGGTRVDTYRMWGVAADATSVATYAWSTRSDVYHYANCSYVRNISPANLARGSSPPAQKRLHTNCPHN